MISVQDIKFLQKLRCLIQIKGWPNLVSENNITWPKQLSILVKLQLVCKCYKATPGKPSFYQQRIISLRGLN